MADKIPIRGGFNGGSLTGLAQFASGDTLGVAHGGTGIVTIGSNALVTGNGTSAMTSESNLTFDGTILKSTGDICATVKVVAPALCIGSEYVLPAADGSAGQLMCTDGSGALAFATASGGVALAGSTNNTIATVTGADALCGEANLTFDGDDLAIGNATPSSYIGSVHGLVIGDNGDLTSEIVLASTNLGASALNFTDLSNGSNRAWVKFDHNTETLDLNTTNTIKFGVEGSEKMRMNASGHVGIGTTAPDHIFHVQDVGENSFNTKAVFDLENTRRSGYTQAALELAPASTAGAFRTRAIAAELIGNQTASDLVFYSESTEHMRISSAGEVLIGYSSGSWADSYGSTHYSGGSAIYHVNGGVAIILRRATSYGDIMQFSHSVGGAAYVGSISVAASSTAYNTSSDYRLKENVVDLTGATTRVAQLQPHRFNFIRDPDTTVDGFVAHEVADIVPEAITGTKDEMRDVENAIVDADGAILEEGKTEAEWVAGKEPTLVSEATEDEVAVYADPIYAADTAWHSTLTVPEYQGIDQSKLVPLLTAAIQELTARITALESA
tara:strand:+ start:4125 stop:5795 length:1671 start_codon:yes stop_codon:yes gene_type:complete